MYFIVLQSKGYSHYRKWNEKIISKLRFQLNYTLLGLTGIFKFKLYVYPRTETEIQIDIILSAYFYDILFSFILPWKSSDIIPTHRLLLLNERKQIHTHSQRICCNTDKAFIQHMYIHQNTHRISIQTSSHIVSLKYVMKYNPNYKMISSSFPLD